MHRTGEGTGEGMTATLSLPGSHDPGQRLVIVPHQRVFTQHTGVGGSQKAFRVHLSPDMLHLDHQTPGLTGTQGAEVHFSVTAKSQLERSLCV